MCKRIWYSLFYLHIRFTYLTPRNSYNLLLFLFKWVRGYDNTPPYYFLLLFNHYIHHCATRRIDDRPWTRLERGEDKENGDSRSLLASLTTPCLLLNTYIKSVREEFYNNISISSTSLHILYLKEK